MEGSALRPLVTRIAGDIPAGFVSVGGEDRREWDFDNRESFAVSYSIYDWRRNKIVVD